MSPSWFVFWWASVRFDAVYNATLLLTAREIQGPVRAMAVDADGAMRASLCPRRVPHSLR
jgi:hypothetical protein